MRVLLVEDHLQLADSVAQALKSTGLTVDVLHDGVAADLVDAELLAQAVVTADQADIHLDPVAFGKLLHQIAVIPSAAC